MHEKHNDITPLRHGWGSNKHLREIALRRRADEEREIVEVPEKFDLDNRYAPQEADYRLLAEIQQQDPR